MAVRLLLNRLGDCAKGMAGKVGGCALGHCREIYGTLTNRRSLFLLIFNGTESVCEHEVWGLPLSLEGVIEKGRSCMILPQDMLFPSADGKIRYMPMRHNSTYTERSIDFYHYQCSNCI